MKMYVHVLYDTVRSRCDFGDTADVVPISYRRMSTNEKKCVHVISPPSDTTLSSAIDQAPTESSKNRIDVRSRVSHGREPNVTLRLRLVSVSCVSYHCTLISISNILTHMNKRLWTCCASTRFYCYSRYEFLRPVVELRFSVDQRNA